MAAPVACCRDGRRLWAEFVAVAKVRRLEAKMDFRELLSSVVTTDEIKISLIGIPAGSVLRGHQFPLGMVKTR